MIARVWTAHATPTQAPAYAAHLRAEVLPALRAIAAYGGAKLLQRREDGSVQLIVVTWWQSLDAVRAFAGADIEQAVVAEAAAALLTSFDDRVRHYEVVVSDEV